MDTRILRTNLAACSTHNVPVHSGLGGDGYVLVSCSFVLDQGQKIKSHPQQPERLMERSKCRN
jgi:hypothetical protein